MKRFKTALIVVIVNLLVIELALSLIYFQQHSTTYSAIGHYASQFARAMRAAQPKAKIGIWQDDEVTGYSHAPSTVGKHETGEFSVQYSIDAQGNRLIEPAQTSIRGNSVVFLGASFTFGWGVNDEQSYPYLLSKKYWPETRVVNSAVSGWGTVHALLKTRQLLAAEDQPGAIVYAMIPDHLQRNYLRKSWLDSLALSERRHPHFELADDQLVYHGLVGAEAAVTDEDEVASKELELTLAYIKTMATEAAEADIPFAVILLPQMHAMAGGPVSWPPALVAMLVEEEITYLDLSPLVPEVENYPIEVHPTPAGHARLAQAIADSDLSNYVQGMTRQ